MLIDYSKTRPQIIKEMIVDYILYLRDEKPGIKLSRSSIKVHLATILHFFQINNNDFNLTARHFRIHLPSDEFHIMTIKLTLMNRLHKFSDLAISEVA